MKKISGYEKALAIRKEIEALQDGHKATLERHMKNGVFFVDPDRVLISQEAVIGRDAVIYPDVILQGACVIGEGVILYPGCRIENSSLGRGTEAAHAVILDSSIGQECQVGPFAYIRPDSIIGDGVRIGDFVEIKKTRIGHGTKVSHLTYLGDAVVGEGVNFGCGTVVVNYDGKCKTQTHVGDYSFIGCNTNLIAPVRVGKNAYTAAGTTVTEDVPDNALAIGRARQQIKPGWVEKKGLKR
ncbi:N-acetylglucosamine-1-phosphate uridyltransferase [Clostridiaceae bacterium JG1575]|nr:N-acetylglucosamine-1-phosphate uridyltransferase [Clostridiaceae bacterium JG1575]